MPPLPPLPDNNTGRVFIEYTSYAIEHTMLLRFDPLPDTGDILAITADLRAAMRDMMLTTDFITGVRYSAAESPISLPLTYTPQAGLVATANAESDPESFFFSVVGRDTVEGRQVRYTMFGVRNGFARAGDNRYTVGEQVPTDGFHLALSDLAQQVNAAPPLVSLGGYAVTLNPYVNCANSAYWQRKQR